jgi:AraC family L-rhamnose operon transcriptional activator RhaR/AraC family L-rhamnose operon regulatory protein RhaS
MIRCAHGQPLKSFSSFTMGNVLEFINLNYQNQISIARLAKLAKMSERSFFRKFKKTVGCSPVDYLTNVRIQHAVKLLNNSNLTISEIATKCGFINNSYFSCIFKKVLGTTPRSFKKKSLSR